MNYKIILSSLFLSLTSLLSFSQATEFKLEPAGLTDFIVTNVDSTSQSKLYQQTLNWIKVTYSNPDKVIQTTIENETIRIEGSKEGLISDVGLTGERLPYLTRYQIEISFKEGKYKFDVLNVEYLTSTLGWQSWSSSRRWDSFFKDGQLRKMYRYYADVPVYFNSLNSELKNYIQNPAGKKSDW